jgi:hypothetical protein
VSSERVPAHALCGPAGTAAGPTAASTSVSVIQVTGGVRAQDLAGGAGDSNVRRPPRGTGGVLLSTRTDLLPLDFAHERLGRLAGRRALRCSHERFHVRCMLLSLPIPYLQIGRHYGSICLSVSLVCVPDQLVGRTRCYLCY